MIINSKYLALFTAGCFVFCRTIGTTKVRHFFTNMKSKQTEKKHEQDEKFTAKWLKSFKGLEHLTEKQAVHLIESMHRFAGICYSLYKQTKTDQQFTQLSPIKTAK